MRKGNASYFWDQGTIDIARTKEIWAFLKEAESTIYSILVASKYSFICTFDPSGECEAIIAFTKLTTGRLPATHVFLAFTSGLECLMDFGMEPTDLYCIPRKY